MIKKAIFDLRKNPPQDIWDDLVEAVREFLSANVRPELIPYMLKNDSLQGKKPCTFVAEEAVWKAIRLVKNQKERYDRAVDFIRDYLAGGGEYDPNPKHLATNAMNAYKGDSPFPFTHGLLIVVAIKVIIPEELEKAEQALQAAREAAIIHAGNGTIRNRAKFSASRKTRQVSRDAQKKEADSPPVEVEADSPPVEVAVAV